MNTTIILFDIDYTLFDTTLFKEIIAKKLLEKVPHVSAADVESVYDEIRKEGIFMPVSFAKIFKEKFHADVTEDEVGQLWYDERLLQQALYPEVVPTLQELKAKGYILGVFSSGEKKFQLQKIKSLSEFLSPQHIHAADFKEQVVGEVMGSYREDNLVVVDDLLPVLQKEKLYKQDLLAIWMKRGKFVESERNHVDFHPDRVITNLGELIEIMTKQ